MRRHLLPALPARRPPTADDRHRHEPHRLPLRVGCRRFRRTTGAAIHDVEDHAARRGGPARRGTRSWRSSTPPDDVPEADRVAYLDNDGTMWCERPTYVQLDFFVDALQPASGGRPVARRTTRVRRGPRAVTRRRSASSGWRASRSRSPGCSRAHPGRVRRRGPDFLGGDATPRSAGRWRATDVPADARTARRTARAATSPSASSPGAAPSSSARSARTSTACRPSWWSARSSATSSTATTRRARCSAAPARILGAANEGGAKVEQHPDPARAAPDPGRRQLRR